MKGLFISFMVGLLVGVAYGLIRAAASIMLRAPTHRHQDEHCGSGCRRHSWPSILVGRVKAKHAPRGKLSAAHKRPPCDSMMERLIRSPMPVP